MTFVNESVRLTCIMAHMIYNILPINLYRPFYPCLQSHDRHMTNRLRYLNNEPCFV